MVKNYKKRSNPYIFKIKVLLKDLIFDGCGIENECDANYKIKLRNCYNNAKFATI
jgi:hypothetical protein